jgi:hypothetical protein
MHKAVLAFAGLAALAWASAAAARTPVVVELYTAQGCSSCAAADRLVDQLADRKGVLPLTFSVDYWDYLGWSDTFARPEFTTRQRAYMQKLGMREVYTPQLIIDGRLQASGASPAKAEALIRQAQRAGHNPPDMTLRRGRLAVGSGRIPSGGAEVWLIRYDPDDQAVLVKRGENRGQTVTQRNVVRQLVQLGTWRGRSKLYAVPAAPSADLKTVILVQATRSGRIIGVLQGS